MADIQKMMTIAEDSRYLSRLQELLTEEPVWLAQNGPTQLTDYLYLGSMSNARDVPNLKRLGITSIVNCAGRSVNNRDLYIKDTDFWVYYPIMAEDNDDYDILQHLPNVQTIIEHARELGGKVMIHCEMGINRSCALCMAHIMSEYGTDLMATFKKMKELRGICVVNNGFQRQLIRFARKHELLYPSENHSHY